MLTRSENDLLTLTGPGTPCGELMRRYWQPVALLEELQANGAPIPVRVLGEDLVLFRDERERIGLLGLRCPHRGVDLSYGRVEDGGLRCIYHGWLFDVTGKCLEQPGEPADSSFKEKIRQRSYPCQEVTGVIFAYLGPGTPPLLPAYEALTAPENYRMAPTKCFHDCNYLQANEGNIDPGHLSFLHRLSETAGPLRNVPGSNLSHYTLLGRDRKPTITVENTDFGLRVYAIRNVNAENKYVRMANFVMPNLCAIPGHTGQDGYQIDWHVPIDDAQHWKYTMAFRRSAPLKEKTSARQDVTAGYRLARNRGNRFLQDRREMQHKSFSGLGANFLAHDVFAVESQGTLQDRTTERLASADQGIVMGRLLMLQAIQEVQRGGDPLHVIRRPSDNYFPHLVVKDEVIPSSKDWQSYWKETLPKNNPPASL